MRGVLYQNKLVVFVEDLLKKLRLSVMTFDEWYVENEIKTYDKTEHECMKMAWNAAIEAALANWDEVDADDIACLKTS